MCRHTEQIGQRRFRIPLFGDVKFTGRFEQSRNDKDERTDIPRNLFTSFRDCLLQKRVELQHVNQMQREPRSSKLPRVFDTDTGDVDFFPSRLRGVLIVSEKYLLTVLITCGFVLQTCGGVRAVDGLLDAKPPGFVELPKPRHNPLPWPSLGSIRLDERPVRRSLSVFFFEVLSDKHGRDFIPRFQARQISSSHDIAFQISKHGCLRISDPKTRQTFFGRLHFVTLLGKLG